MAEIYQENNQLILDREKMASNLGFSRSKFNSLMKQYDSLHPTPMPIHQHGINKQTPYLFNSPKVNAWLRQLEQQELIEKIKVLEAGQTYNDEESKSRKLAAEAKLKEIELEKEQEQLANIDDVMGAFGDCLGKVRAALMSLPSRTSGELEHQDQQYIEDTLNNEVRNILTDLSDYES
jgi:hypothetical protein